MNKLYTINQETASVLDAAQAPPVMLYAFEGFVDSGIAAGLMIADTVNQAETKRLVTFKADELIDYRSRRPPVTFADGGWTGYSEPSLGIDLAVDSTGQPFLLMYGPEPDLKWEAFTDAVVEIVETFDVRLTVGMHGMPSPSPHTREWRVTGPGNSQELISQVAGSPDATIQLPGSAMALTEFKLREVGREAHTFAVHVPQYLSQMPSPIATLKLMQAIENVTELDFDLSRLEGAAARQQEQIERQVEENEELAAAIKKMENVHDERIERAASAGAAARLGAVPLPSGEELAAELEQFLASQGATAAAGPELEGNAGQDLAVGSVAQVDQQADQLNGYQAGQPGNAEAGQPADDAPHGSPEDAQGPHTEPPSFTD
ncbi:MAG: PAC2 family protein [Bifidobacteriaceae bacterium]|jgi:hypothetical protein|nr:PAC2 family protein [Bifidobacteriaceae bacterium]